MAVNEESYLVSGVVNRHFARDLTLAFRHGIEVKASRQLGKEGNITVVMFSSYEQLLCSPDT